MESIRAADVEKFVQGLGSLLPPEVIKSLVDEVRRQRIDGAHFNELLAGRSNIQFSGQAVRPAHIATLRKCWSAKYSGGRGSRAPSHAGTNRSDANSTATDASKRGSSMRNSRPSRAAPADGAKQSHIGDGNRASQAGRERPKSSIDPRRSRSSASLQHQDSGPVSVQRSESAHSHSRKDDVDGKRESRAGGLHPSKRQTSAKVLPSHEEKEDLQSSASKQSSQGGKTSSQPQQAWATPEKPKQLEAPPAPVTPERSASMRHTASDDDPYTPLAPVKHTRRPAQVPPLDLSFIHKKDGAEKSQKLVEAKTMAPANPVKPEQQPAAVAPAVRIPSGYGGASPEDQQRIAAFYGYRDQGFKATMHGLKTNEIRPRLYLGTMADAAYWPLLKALGISHVVNCATEAQNSKGPYEAHGIKYFFMPLQDTPEEAATMSRQSFKSLREATRFIQASLKSRQNSSVFVHCVQGLSRSAALVCAYLIEFEGLSMDRALADIRNRHKGCLSSHHWQALLYKFDAEYMKAGAS